MQRETKTERSQSVPTGFTKKTKPMLTSHFSDTQKKKKAEKNSKEICQNGA